ncbi:MAG: hypothetical protein JWN04_2056 [Myxococcaceae bacterium]|nr:hypothetical protein [Myxococcaceae bacterium]
MEKTLNRPFLSLAVALACLAAGGCRKDTQSAKGASCQDVAQALCDQLAYCQDYYSDVPSSRPTGTSCVRETLRQLDCEGSDDEVRKTCVDKVAQEDCYLDSSKGSSFQPDFDLPASCEVLLP